MDLKFDIDISEFQERKRRRISALQNTPAPPLKPAPTSTPGIHEIAGFLPGRLEFEHELDNEAEDLVKDLEFGICLEWGGDAIPEDENDPDVKARAKWLEEKRGGGAHTAKCTSHPVDSKAVVDGLVNGKMPMVNGKKHATPVNGRPAKSSNDENPADSGSTEGEGNTEEITHPLPLETKESLQFKLTLIEAYCQRVQRRREAKAVIYDRGLLEYKKVIARV
jgi:transcriptional adapter 2-alpha